MRFNPLALSSLSSPSSCYCSPLDSNGVLASGIGGVAVVGTPVKAAHEGIKERHRHVFNKRLFPDLFHGPNNEKMKELKDHPDTKVGTSEMSQREWEETINVVLNFGPKRHDDATEDQKKFRKSLGPKKAKNWARIIELYKVEEYILPGSGQQRKRLLRSHQRKGWAEPRWLLCIPQLEVFDAIHEHHGTVSHMKMNQTCVKVHEKYYNITEKQVNAFVATCETCNHKNPVVKAMKGAKKPILSECFRDRFQVDLIDMRSCEMDDVYENTMRWILTLKDHSTQLTYLVPLPRKRASYVAYELDRIFGLIGYPSIFHTDNGKEFTANEILELLKEYSESIITVTGRPRTPRDQGSVESMNKLVKQIIHDLENEERLKGNKAPNWTRLLGRAMQTINSKKERGKHATEPYEAVFGQSYHMQISCSLSEMRQCKTIEDRLKLSADDRLQNIAEEVCDMDNPSTLDSPPVESYWEVDEEQHKSSSPAPPKESLIGTSTNHEHPSTENHVSCLPCSAPVISESLAVKASRYRHKYSVSEAISENKTTTRRLRSGNRNTLGNYEFIYPTLECDCCHLGSSLISVGDESYLIACSDTKRWYDHDFISSFGALASHRAHSISKEDISIQFITCNYPNEIVEESARRQLTHTTQRVVSVFHGKQHYVVAEIDLSEKACTITDGLRYGLKTWTKHIENVLKRCSLISLDDNLWFRNGALEVNQYERWTIRYEEKFVTQTDSYNCGPLACMKLCELFLDSSILDDDLDYANYRAWVTSQFKMLVDKCSNDLFVSLHVSVPSQERCDVDTPPCDDDVEIECFCGDDRAPSSLTIKLDCCNKRQHAICAYNWLEMSGTCALCRKEMEDIEFQGSKIPVGSSIWAATTSHDDSHFTNKTDMDIHAKDLSSPSKDAMKISTEASTPSDEVTPLRQADSNRKRAQDLKRKRQEEQAKKMIRTRSRQDTGVGIGAVVTISLDKRDYSNATGVRAVVYDVKNGTGGILACCEHGIISLKDKKDFWIPVDRYGVTSSPAADSVLTDDLVSIREEVLTSSFDVSKKPRITLAQAQKRFTNRSPRRKTCCRCKNGNCGAQCGCREKGPCSSGCSCNGNCSRSRNSA